MVIAPGRLAAVPAAQGAPVPHDTSGNGAGHFVTVHTENICCPCAAAAEAAGGGRAAAGGALGGHPAAGGGGAPPHLRQVHPPARAGQGDAGGLQAGAEGPAGPVMPGGRYFRVCGMGTTAVSVRWDEIVTSWQGALSPNAASRADSHQHVACAYPDVVLACRRLHCHSRRPACYQQRT